MKIEQIYTKCLAQGAYYIVSDGEAVIIDPLRDISAYIEKLNEDKAVLKYIFETHFHADFVSGHIDLSDKTGAPIVYGPNASPNFKAIIAEDQQVFQVGSVKIKVLHTPGHTLESSCFLLLDELGKETALFSGDTLFLGDVGRPDLAQKSANMTQDDLAGLLYDSLYGKILPLSDDIIVYPAHGAGSACGKNMMNETSDLLGNQKKSNYALNQNSKEDFIKAVTDGLLQPPAYFGMNVSLNKKGYNSFDEILQKSLKKLSVSEFEEISNQNEVMILDTRSHKDFAEGFVPTSINIGLNGDFAPWVGAVIINVNQPLVLVVEEGSELEVITRLSRVGFDNVLGILDGGFNAWKNANKKIDTINRVAASKMEKEIENRPSKIIDVRKESEYLSEHLLGAENQPLAYINEWVKEIDENEFFYIHCAGGYRSMIAASILLSKGYRNFAEIEGGFEAISETNMLKSEKICPSQITI